MLLFLVVWPIVAIALELVIAVLILVVAVAGRIVLRRPWTICAAAKTGGGRREHTWSVVGWRPSSRLIEDVTAALEQGGGLPDGAPTAGPSPRP